MKICDIILEDIGVRGVWMLYAPEVMKKLNNLHPELQDELNNDESRYRQIWMDIIRKVDPSANYQFAKWITRQFLDYDLTEEMLNQLKDNLVKYLELLSQGKLTRQFSINYLNINKLNTLVNSELPRLSVNDFYYEDKDLMIDNITSYDQFKKVKSPYWNMDVLEFQDIVKTSKLFLVKLKNNKNMFLFNFERSIFRDKENNFIGKDHLKLLVDHYPGLLSAFGNRLKHFISY